VSSSLTSYSRASVARPQFRPSQLSFTPSSLRPAIASRWYSSEAEAKKDGEAAKEAEDPTKKELETSKKEIIELKVCHPGP